VRVVVVGAGIVGLLTAVECDRGGAEVTVVDRGDIPSTLATSYDHHRVVRALHQGSAPLTTAAARTHRAWQEVDVLAGGGLYHRTGSLTALPPGELPSTMDMLGAAGVPASAVPPDRLAGRHAALRFPAGVAGVYEPDAGTVLAGRTLTALAGWLRGRPAVTLRPRLRVAGVAPGAVRLAGGAVLAADRVVVAAGPWSRELVPAAGLTLYRQSMLSYDPGAARAAWAGVPAVPRFGTPEGAWLMPPVAGTPVRLSAASACRAVPGLAERATPPRWREHLVALFADLLAGFDPAAVVDARDAYYLSAAGGPLLADLGGGVLAYAACGGMSFKFAPLIAAALADRALGRAPRLTGIDQIDEPQRLAAQREVSR
jgi:sarcosine oxidase